MIKQLTWTVGMVNKVEADHIGLLVHGVFNCSIQKGKGLIDDQYTYDSGDNRWKAKSDDRKDIAVGSELKFTVTE